MKEANEKKNETKGSTIRKIMKASIVIDAHAEDKLPYKVSLKLFRFRKAIEPSVEFYRRKISEILEEYGLKDEKGRQKFDERGNPLVDRAKTAECNAAIAELESCEAEKPDIVFDEDDLEKLELSMNDLAALEDFIE